MGQWYSIFWLKQQEQSRAQQQQHSRPSHQGNSRAWQSRGPAAQQPNPRKTKSSQPKQSNSNGSSCPSRSQPGKQYSSKQQPAREEAMDPAAQARAPWRRQETPLPPPPNQREDPGRRETQQQQQQQGTEHTATAPPIRINPLVAPISKAEVYKGKGKGSNIPAAFRNPAFRPHTPKVVPPPNPKSSTGAPQQEHPKPSARATDREQTRDPPRSSQLSKDRRPTREPSYPPPGRQDSQARPQQKRGQARPGSAAPPMDMPFRATGWKNKMCWLLASYQAGQWDQCKQMATTYIQELQEQDPPYFVDGKAHVGPEMLVVLRPLQQPELATMPTTFRLAPRSQYFFF